MDHLGDIYIAVEEIALQSLAELHVGYPRLRGYEHPSEHKKLGHPTLLGGGEARIAGELALDEMKGKLHWFLNAHSGRYCRQLPPSKSQLASVAASFKQFGVLVEVDDF